MSKVNNFLRILTFEIKVEIERFLEAHKIYYGEYDINPLHSEQYLKHFVSTALLRISGGLCLQEVSVDGNHQSKHKVDFIVTHNGNTYAIEFKTAWIGTRNKKASGAHPRNALDAAWIQVADIKKKALTDWPITHRLALSLGTPWFKIKTKNENINEKIVELEANLERVRERLKDSLNNKFMEVKLTPLSIEDKYYHIEWHNEKKEEIVEFFPSFFMLWKDSKV